MLEREGMPVSPISKNRLKNELCRWIANLDYPSIVSAWQDQEDAIPEFHFDENGMTLYIRPVPRRDRPKGSRAIGGVFSGIEQIKPEERIRAALKKKATRYGTLDLPYIICVNTLGDYFEEEDVLDALFGTPAVRVSSTPVGWTEQETRVNAFWQRNLNTRVSAVFATERLNPWSVAQSHARLIFNPWAQNPISSFDLNVRRLNVGDQGQLMPDGDSALSRVFELNPGWPGDI